MEALRLQTTVPQSGELRLRLWQFRPGESVEVIVLPLDRVESSEGDSSLTNTVLRYDDPTEPVAEQDWDALR